MSKRCKGCIVWERWCCYLTPGSYACARLIAQEERRRAAKRAGKQGGEDS